MVAHTAVNLPVWTDGKVDATEMIIIASDAAFGVSEKHGRVMRQMPLLVPFGDKIHSVTNGVSRRYWPQEAFQDLGEVAALEDTELVSIRDREREAFIRWLAVRQGLGNAWAEEVLHNKRPIGIWTRRIVAYKRLDRLADMLEDKTLRERFLKTGVVLVYGGRIHQDDRYGLDQHQRIQKIIRRDPRLAGRLIFFDNHNVWEAPHLFQGADFSIMLADQNREASATGFQKAQMNGGLIVASEDGAVSESVTFYDGANEDVANGFNVPYDAEGSPTAQGLLGALEQLSQVFQDKATRGKMIRNALHQSPRVSVERTAQEMLRLFGYVLKVSEEEALAYREGERTIDKVYEDLSLSSEEAERILDALNQNAASFTWKYKEGDAQEKTLHESAPGLEGFLEGYRHIHAMGTVGLWSTSFHSWGKEGRSDILAYLEHLFENVPSLEGLRSLLQQEQKKLQVLPDSAWEERLKVNRVAVGLATRLVMQLQETMMVHDGGKKRDDSDERLTRIAEAMQQRGFVTEIVDRSLEVEWGRRDQHWAGSDVIYTILDPYPTSQETVLLEGEIVTVSFLVFRIAEELLLNVRHAESDGVPGQLLMASRTVKRGEEEFVELIVRNLRGEIPDILQAVAWGYSRLGSQSEGMGLPSVIMTTLGLFGGEVHVASRGVGLIFSIAPGQTIAGLEDYEHVLATSILVDSNIKTGTQIMIRIPKRNGMIALRREARADSGMKKQFEIGERVWYISSTGQGKWVFISERSNENYIVQDGDATFGPVTPDMLFVNGEEAARIALRRQGVVTEKDVEEVSDVIVAELRDQGLGIEILNEIDRAFENNDTLSTKQGEAFYLIRDALEREGIPAERQEEVYQKIRSKLLEKDHSQDGGRRILYVEDEEVIQKIMVQILEDRGFEVTAVSSYEEAEQLLQSEVFDLLFTDNSFPETPEGHTVHHSGERLIEAHPEVKAILYTGRDPEQAAEKIGKANYVEVLGKPTPNDVLLEKVESLLRSEGTEEARDGGFHQFDRTPYGKAHATLRSLRILFAQMDRVLQEVPLRDEKGYTDEVRDRLKRAAGALTREAINLREELSNDMATQLANRIEEFRSHIDAARAVQVVNDARITYLREFFFELVEETEVLEHELIVTHLVRKIRNEFGRKRVLDIGDDFKVERWIGIPHDFDRPLLAPEDPLKGELAVRALKAAGYRLDHKGLHWVLIDSMTPNDGEENIQTTKDGGIKQRTLRTFPKTEPLLPSFQDLAEPFLQSL